MNIYAHKANTGHKQSLVVPLVVRLVFVTVVILVFGCGEMTPERVAKITDQSKLASIALNAEGYSVRVAAIHQLSDQALLAKIAVEATNEYVCIAAVQKLTNQALLERIVVEAKDLDTDVDVVSRYAIDKLTDQDMLARIAVGARDLGVSIYALNKLTNQALLAKIAIEDNRDFVSRSPYAVEKLTDHTLLAKLAVEGRIGVRINAIEKLATQVETSVNAISDNDAQHLCGFLHYFQAFKNVEDRHRTRLMSVLVPAIDFLVCSDVTNYLGRVVSINIKWQPIVKNYTRLDWPGSDMSSDGEDVHCTLSWEDGRDVSGSWRSDFPENTRSLLGFYEAPVQGIDILRPAFARLPRAELWKIAVEGSRSECRRAAVTILWEQPLLAKIAVEDKEAEVRAAAVKRLTDQALLARIAVEDKDEDVRFAAVHKLTDQSVLAKIVVEDKEAKVRAAAVDRLTDQTLLARIAVEDKNRFFRHAAVQKLSDQSVLAKIAVEDKDKDVRFAAIKKLTDQALLAQVAIKAEDEDIRKSAKQRVK